MSRDDLSYLLFLASQLERAGDTAFNDANALDVPVDSRLYFMKACLEVKCAFAAKELRRLVERAGVQ